MTANPTPLLYDLIPDHIHNSSLLNQGGFAVYVGLPDAYTQQLMLTEALEAFPTAREDEVTTPDNEERRGGMPQRRYLNSAGGSVQEAFYRSDQTLHSLRQITGIPSVTTSGLHGTYTYYARPGDFLALHRDIEVCELAVISVLYDNADIIAGDCGALCLYSSRALEPLSAIRTAPEQGAIPLRLKGGQTIVMLGGIVPHQVLPMSEGQTRIVSILCYKI